MSTAAPPIAPSGDTALAAIRARLAAAGGGAWGGFALGTPAIDAHLPAAGLALGALHEVAAAGLAAETGALTAAFAACLLARLADPRPVLWLLAVPDLFGHGLHAYGLDPARLLLADCPDDRATLAAAEVALRDGAVAAVVAEVGGLPRLAARRLALAAQARGSLCLVLRRWPYGRKAAAGGAAAREGNAAATRWRLAPARSERPEGIAARRGPGRPRWVLELAHARGGRPGAWVVEVAWPDRWWQEEGHAPRALRVVAELAHAAPAPPARGTGPAPPGRRRATG